MSVGFGEDATRQVQKGDTPDLNDGLLSRVVPTSENINRGQACVIIAGDVTVATAALVLDGYTPFVPIETVDNTTTGDLPISGVGPTQRVALGVITTSTINPGDIVKVSDTQIVSEGGFVELWSAGDTGADDNRAKYARYLGREAALLVKSGPSDFIETLSPGIVPDQPILGSEPNGTVGWFQLLDTQGGTDAT